MSLWQVSLWARVSCTGDGTHHFLQLHVVRGQGSFDDVRRRLNHLHHKIHIHTIVQPSSTVQIQRHPGHPWRALKIPVQQEDCHALLLPGLWKPDVCINSSPRRRSSKYQHSGRYRSEQVDAREGRWQEQIRDGLEREQSVWSRCCD